MKQDVGPHQTLDLLGPSADIQPPELGGIHFCHLTTQSVVTYSSRVD